MIVKNHIIFQPFFSPDSWNAQKEELLYGMAQCQLVHVKERHAIYNTELDNMNGAFA